MPLKLLLRVVSCCLAGAVVGIAGLVRADATFTTGWLSLGDGWQTPYYIQEAAKTGPVVMIIGGVHGNEPAGAAAANDIRHWEITQGTLIVVPFAAPQAMAVNTRTIPNEGDLNRNFPGVGDPIDATTGPTADALWDFVRQQSPAWLLDLHEGYDFRSSGPDSVGSSIIHANERVTNAYVDRMLIAVNQEITDPDMAFISLTGPVDDSLARASVVQLGTRGMIVETTTKDQPLTLRVDQHRTIINQFLSDQQMLTGPYGGDRGPILDEFTFDEPEGMSLPKVGNSLPHGAVWNTSPFDSRASDGRFRIQRDRTGTASTTTGVLGAGEIRVRGPFETTNTPTDIQEGFASLVVSGWDFRSTTLGERISFGFRSTVSPDVLDTAQIVFQRTGLNEVSVSGLCFGVGSGNIPAATLFGAEQNLPVQFILQLNKGENLDGSPVVAGADAGGFYRIYYQLPGQNFVEIGAGAAVRQARNGDHLTMQIAGPIGANNGFFDIDQITYSSAFPELLLPEPTTGPVYVVVSSGRLSQAQAGYPTIPVAESVTKLGTGTVVFNAANTYVGPTTIAAGTLEVAHANALGSTPVTIAPGATLAVASGITVRSPEVTVAGGTLSAASLTVSEVIGITSLTINAGTVTGATAVSIGAGGRMSLGGNARLSLSLGGLAVDQAAGGRLDVGAGEVLIAADGITATELRADLVAGRSGGSWNGTGGITSATAAATGGARTVGYVVSSDGSARVSFAAPGDTNLDGQVNVFDLVTMMGSGTYGTGRSAVWSEGDFNYDGLTDVFDLVGVGSAGAYGRGNYFPVAPPADGFGLPTAVPEPAGWLLAASGLIVSCGFRYGRLASSFRARQGVEED